MRKQEYKKENIKDLLKKNEKAVYRGILAIYRLQTIEERNIESTINKNGVGFSSFDAHFMSEIAKLIKSGNRLSPKQFYIARNKVFKYAGQLAKIANGEI